MPSFRRVLPPSASERALAKAQSPLHRTAGVSVVNRLRVAGLAAGNGVLLCGLGCGAVVIAVDMTASPDTTLSVSKWMRDLSASVLFMCTPVALTARGVPADGPSARLLSVSWCTPCTVV